MSEKIDIIIVEKSGSLKTHSIKDFQQDTLYKKCGFKKGDDFLLQTEWKVKLEKKPYIVQLFAKTVGRAGLENKYDFPPPVDQTLFFGSCALVGYIIDSHGVKKVASLQVSLWEAIYEKLFGGFEDLSKHANSDEEEVDELALIPKEKKTKNGYLKDGFVVDSSDTDDFSSRYSHPSSPSGSDSLCETSETDTVEDVHGSEKEGKEGVNKDSHSELSEEEYE